MTGQEIKDRLKQKNLSMAEIARRCDVSQTAVQLFVDGKSTSRRIEKSIARALGLKLDEFRTARMTAQN